MAHTSTYLITSTIAGIPVRISIEVCGTSQVTCTPDVSATPTAVADLTADLVAVISEGLSEHFGA